MKKLTKKQIEEMLKVADNFEQQFTFVDRPTSDSIARLIRFMLNTQGAIQCTEKGWKITPDPHGYREDKYGSG